jgi:hypothetical protein
MRKFWVGGSYTCHCSVLEMHAELFPGWRPRKNVHILKHVYRLFNSLPRRSSVTRPAFSSASNIFYLLRLLRARCWSRFFLHSPGRSSCHKVLKAFPVLNDLRFLSSIHAGCALAAAFLPLE